MSGRNSEAQKVVVFLFNPSINSRLQLPYFSFFFLSLTLFPFVSPVASPLSIPYPTFSSYCPLRVSVYQIWYPHRSIVDNFLFLHNPR